MTPPARAAIVEELAPAKVGEPLAPRLIALGVSLWLLYRQWRAMLARSAGRQPSAAGGPILIVGLLLYLLGRSQDILIFEIGSVIWVLLAVLLILRGTAGTKAQWFALFFMVLMYLSGYLSEDGYLLLTQADDDRNQLSYLYFNQIIERLRAYATLMNGICATLRQAPQ